MHIGSEHLFAGIPVGELARAREFYERLIGRAPDLHPNAQEVCWQLHPGAWIVLIEGDATLGRTQHTLLVSNLEDHLDAARERGVQTGPIEPVGGGMRQSVVVDPDGNRLKLAAPLS